LVRKHFVNIIATEAKEIKKAIKENERALDFQTFYNQIYNLTDFKIWAKSTIRHSKLTTLTHSVLSPQETTNIYYNLNEVSDNFLNHSATSEYSPLQINILYKQKNMSNNGSKASDGGGVQEMDFVDNLIEEVEQEKRAAAMK
jgi:hypothetical protein